MTTALSTQNASGIAAFSQDIEIPKLNIIQKMSQIDGDVGSVVLDKEVQILDAEQKTPVIVIGAIKRWKEDIPYDSDVVPKIVDTEAEARALAEESSYEVTEFADIVLLIPQIGDDDTHFPYPIGDTNYQLGRITVQKDAYRMTFKRLVTFATFNPDVPVSSRYWKFGTEMLTKGKYSWYVPVLTITKDEAPEEVATFAARATQTPA